MTVDLEWLAVESGRLKAAARRINREVTRLRDENAGLLKRFELPVGAPIDERAVLDFLHRAISSSPEGVVITVSQPARAQTKESPDGEDVQSARDCR